MTRHSVALPPLLVVGGKGGVGKTLVACALARAAAAADRRVLLLELDVRESLYRFLGIEPSGGDRVEVGGGLWAQSLRPRDVVDGWIEERVRPRFVARRLVQSLVYEQFVEGAPGLREVAALGRAVEQARSSESWDLVILDAPASGHATTLLTAPRLLAEAIAEGPVAALAREVAEAVADPGETSLWAVATAEGMAIREALDLDRALHRGLGRGLDQLVLNMLLPEPRLVTGGDDFWSRRAAHQAARLATLGRSWPRAPVRLPMSRHEGVAAVTELTAVLAAEIAT